MKRVYEKPVMMVEGFVVNEYVAACYEVICNGMSDGSFKNYQHTAHSWVIGHTQIKETTTIYNNGNQPKVVDSFNDGNENHYSVTYNEITSTAHPNASM